MPNQTFHNHNHNNAQVEANGRTFAIGDIHGHHQQLVNLIDAIAPNADDTLIFLGDYVDRGPDSKAVIDTIIALQSVCEIIMLKGNHEVMMAEAMTTQHLKNRQSLASGWLKYGGIETLASYGMETSAYLTEQLLSNKATDHIIIPDAVKAHLHLIETLPLYYITDTHIFVHASPKLDIDIDAQDEECLLWRRTSKRNAELNYAHHSGKTIICGHTAQEDGMPKRLSSKSIIIDTGCYDTGRLTAIEVASEHFIQANVDSYWQFE